MLLKVGLLFTFSQLSYSCQTSHHGLVSQETVSVFLFELTYTPINGVLYVVIYLKASSFVKGKMFVGHWIKYVIYQLKWFKLFMVKLCWPGLEEENKEYDRFILMGHGQVYCWYEK